MGNQQINPENKTFVLRLFYPRVQTPIYPFYSQIFFGGRTFCKKRRVKDSVPVGSTYCWFAVPLLADRNDCEFAQQFRAGDHPHLSLHLFPLNNSSEGKFPIILSCFPSQPEKCAEKKDHRVWSGQARQVDL